MLTAKSTETSAADRVLVYKTQHLREVLPDDLQIAYDQTRAREATEMLCLLYVAMTRAVHALHMILPYEKLNKTKENLAGVLLADWVAEPSWLRTRRFTRPVTRSGTSPSHGRPCHLPSR